MPGPYVARAGSVECNADDTIGKNLPPKFEEVVCYAKGVGSFKPVSYGNKKVDRIELSKVKKPGILWTKVQNDNPEQLDRRWRRFHSFSSKQLLYLVYRNYSAF